MLNLVSDSGNEKSQELRHKIESQDRIDLTNPESQKVFFKAPTETAGNVFKMPVLHPDSQGTKLNSVSVSPSPAKMFF